MERATSGIDTRRSRSMESVEFPHSVTVANPSRALLTEPPPDSAADSALYYESLYDAAEGDTDRLPWGHTEPNPSLVAWLNHVAPGVVRPGGRVVVVGCGLGEEVAELEARGYDATGFDVSPSAVKWAQRLTPRISDRFRVADLFALPTTMTHRFDLAIDIDTLCCLNPALRERAAASITSLTKPHGVVLSISAGCDPGAHEDGALCAPSLTGLMALGGMQPAGTIDDYYCNRECRRRIRGAFRRA
ncbi:MAG: class I SAM-dependent methyltransferase [Phycisphaerales bacterium]|jgi:SAM-dependent methyltransferase|nr:class I SAM-dependent methyltransferase [Phycisphaerales bacterium]